MAPALEDFRIRAMPPSAYYLSEFITAEEEQQLLGKINNVPKPRWTTLSHRRLQAWPSNLHRDTLLGGPLPSWLTEPVVDRLLSIQRSASDGRGIFESSPHGGPNHCLINEYHAGQGIMAHKDGPAYHPIVCTISLGASICLEIYKSKDDGAIDINSSWRILQEPRSLLITTEELYTDYLHGISDMTEDANLDSTTVSNWDLLSAPGRITDGKLNRQTRVSLTYRDVIKTSKLGAKLGLFGKR